MTTYTFPAAKLEHLQDKTILIFGAASGIGRALLDIAHVAGARVAFGDWQEEEGKKIVTQLGERVFFRKCDVSNWEDVGALFFETWKKWGTIHSVISNAGVNTHEGFLDDQYDDTTGTLLPPDLKSIKINLLGQLYVVKCAMHFIKHWPEVKTSIVMTGSAGSFIPAPPIHLYCAAKAGIVGFMRAIKYDVAKRNATINVVAPWLTVTPMLRPDWLKAWGDLPQNTTTGVAYALLLPVLEPHLNGKSFFVAGDEIVELEDTIHDTQPGWMGHQLSENVDKGQHFLLSQAGFEADSSAS